MNKFKLFLIFGILLVLNMFSVSSIGMELPGGWDSPEVPPELCGNGICEVVVFDVFEIYVDETDPESEYYCPEDCEPVVCEECEECSIAACEELGLVLLGDCPSSCSGGGGCSREWCESSGYFSGTCTAEECRSLGYSVIDSGQSQISKSSSEEGESGSSNWILWIIIIIEATIIGILFMKKDKQYSGKWIGGRCIPQKRLK